ncbi:DoxX family protein [Nocardia sp. NPDC059240]|uniref:DoxX family protein n=1 Tax=Nocardia sp. NPDC059240 TaxID=3346786 RepID=UPI00369F1319
MNLTLWLLQALLAAIFSAAGIFKLTQPIDVLAAKLGGWVHDFSPRVVRLIGALEVTAAVGLIAPAAVKIVPILTAFAAVGLVATMVGAAVVHLRHKDFGNIAGNLLLMLIAAVVAWGRLVPYAY